MLAQLLEYLLQSAGETERFGHVSRGLRQARRAPAVVILQTVHAGRR
jgi:hypothetical protein